MSQQIARLTSSVTPAMAARMPALSDPAGEADRLALALTPATAAEATEVLQYLFQVLPMANGGETEKAKDDGAKVMTVAYLTALQGQPKWAIVEVRGDYIAGRIEGQSLRFAPKPPEIGHAVAQRVASLRERLGRMRRQAEERRALGAEDERRPLSPEARERGRQAIERLRAAGADEARRLRGHEPSPGYVDPNPITEEALDAAGVPLRGVGPMERIEPPAFDPMSRRVRT